MQSIFEINFTRKQCTSSKSDNNTLCTKEIIEFQILKQNSNKLLKFLPLPLQISFIYKRSLEKLFTSSNFS